MSNILACNQLLELNVIAAQDLAPVGRSMRTYAVAWIDPDRKLSTRVDLHGGTDPTWNDKFVFQVDEDFLYDDNSTITIDIYALHWFQDIHVGTAHVLAEDIIPPSHPNHNNYNPTGMRFVGLQVRRASGRSKGILNVGVAVIDSSMRSMPLFTHNTPVVEYHHHDHHNQPTYQVEPKLRRTKSDTSSMMGFEATTHKKQAKAKRGRASSQVTPFEVSINNKKEASSTLSGSDVKAKTPKRGKFDKRKKNYQNEQFNATANVSYDYEVKPSPKPQFQNSSTPARAYKNGGVRATPLHAFGLTNAAVEQDTPYRSNMGHHHHPPIITNSELGPSASEVAAAVARQPVMEEGANVSYDYEGKPSSKPQFQNSSTPARAYNNGDVRATPLHAFVLTNATVEHDTPYRSNMGYHHHRPIITDSELGPSASEVAAARQPVMEEGANVSYDYEVKPSPKPQFVNSSTPARVYNNGGVRATPLHAAVERDTPYRSNMGHHHHRLIITDSELGPSASEVAATVARQPVMEEGENSTVGEWSLDESVEGLQPKIERWRTDLAPVHDGGEKSTLPTSSSKKKGKHSRRRTEGGGGNGLFSCFSVICGLECSIVCGGDKKKKGLRRTQSVDNTSFH